MTAAPSHLGVLVIGHAQRLEFQDAVEWLRQHLDMRWYPSPGHLTDAELDQLTPPTWIVLLASYPGQFPNAQLDRLRRWFPLAEWVLVRGSWCEGVSRAAGCPNGIPLLPAHQFVYHLRCQLAGCLMGHNHWAEPFWPVPPTAAGEEYWLTIHAAPSHPSTGSRGRWSDVLIAGRDPQTVDALCDGLQTSVCRPRPVTIPSGERPDPATAAVYAAGLVRSHWDGDVSWLRQHLAQGPIVALVAAPRWDEHRQLIAAGATHVMGQPIVLEHLRAALSWA